jgi:hypothetical protein
MTVSSERTSAQRKDDSLAGRKIEAAVETAQADGTEGERGHVEWLQQDVVRFAPVRLAGVGRKQAVAADRAHAPQRTAHRFVKTRLVGELIDQLVARDDDQRRAHHVQPEDRPQFLGKARKVLHGRSPV